MPLLNYTTKVPAATTIGEVQSMLVKAGARQVVADYDDAGTTVGLAFGLMTEYGPRTFCLPVSIDKVEPLLAKQLKGDPSARPFMRTREHAERVAWRILKDWIEAQLAIIATEMVTLDQVMLPYMADESGQTVYELYRDRQLALPAGPENGSNS